MRNVIRIISLWALACCVAIAFACSGKQQAPHFSAIYVPTSSLTVAQWYIDVLNATGCASDSNNGTNSTGTPNGPLLTAYGLVAGRWNCQSAMQGCARLPQNTTITYLSEYATA